jgi:hypothetical protein
MAVLEGEYVSFAEAAGVVGIDKYRMAVVVKRAGVPVYRSPQDARKKFLKRDDLARLTAYYRVEASA